jgi:hypothetical protein
MFWLMSSSPKTANVLSRPGVLGRLSDAHRRNSVLQSTGFHQCLGLLKKHRSETPPAGPISTSIYASKSASISASKYTTLCATTSRNTEADVLCSDRQNPVLRPVPGSRNRNARRPSKDGSTCGHRAAARRRAQPIGSARRASWTAEHMKRESGE